MNSTEFITYIVSHYNVLQRRYAAGKIDAVKFYALADRLQLWEDNYQDVGYLPW